MAEGTGRGSEEGKEVRSEAEQTKEGKEEARRCGGTKRGSALGPKLKSRGCNSSHLNTILFTNNYYRSIGKAVFDQAGGKQHNIKGGANRAETWRG